MRKVEIARGSADIKVSSIDKIKEVEQLSQLISDGRLKVLMFQPEGQVLKVQEQNPPQPSQNSEPGFLKANSFFEGTGDGWTPFVKSFDQTQNAIYLKNKSTENILTLMLNGQIFKLDPLEIINDGMDPFDEISILMNGEFKGYVKRFADKQVSLMQFFNNQYFEGAYFE